MIGVCLLMAPSLDVSFLFVFWGVSGRGCSNDTHIQCFFKIETSGFKNGSRSFNTILIFPPAFFLRLFGSQSCKSWLISRFRRSGSSFILAFATIVFVPNIPNKVVEC